MPLDAGDARRDVPAEMQEAVRLGVVELGAEPVSEQRPLTVQQHEQKHDRAQRRAERRGPEESSPIGQQLRIDNRPLHFQRP